MTEHDRDREQLVSEFTGEAEAGFNAEEREANDRRIWEEKLQVFGDGIEAEADEYERVRRPIELRMLEDMRQFQGIEESVDRLNKKQSAGGSDLNVNITRKKTNAADARLSDMLFPTDDKNWGIEPSPVPLLAVQGMPKSALPPEPPPQPMPQGMPPGMPAMPGAQPGMPPAQGQPQAQGMDPGAMGMPAQESAEVAPGAGMLEGMAPVEAPEAITPEKAAERDAKARADLMEKVLDDQLTECRYQAAGRDAIRSAVMFGTGVLKGPVLLGKGRRVWEKKTDEQGNSARVIKEIPDENPGFEFVPIWDFFPTMSATCIADSEINFQRHWATRRDLIRLAKREDFLKDQIRRVLKNSPNRVPPDYLTQLRSMSDISSVGDEKRYVVWERHGPIRVEDLQLCGVIDATEEVDPLDEYEGVVWVCQGIVIKAAVNPMDTEDQPFSVFNFEEDDSCIFGYGVPFLMRSPQKVVKSAWRMIMDNAGLSVGGQIIINKMIVEPARDASGVMSWEISPLKVWLLKDKMARAQDAFHIFEFPNHQQELAAIFNLARELADEETGIPVIAEGEQGNTTTTARGMEMLMNSHNIVMRRAVKNWDDHMTVPNITRLYDWNMQHNPNEDVKGDYSPTARGSSALLQKETQSRNMLNLINFLMTPAFMGWVKQEETVKRLVTSMQHDPDDLIKTKAEYDKDMQAQQGQQQEEPDHAVEVQRMKNDLAYKIHQDKLANLGAERQFKGMMMDREKEIQMMKLAQEKEMSLEKVSTSLQAIHAKSVADRTLMADEFKIKLETGSGI